MRVSIIVAVAENGVIGRDNDLPWHLSADLRRFKRLTMGHHLLMGRKTFDSIGRPLPGRHMVVISRGRPDLPDEILLAPSLERALAIAEQAGETEAFVAGGSQIYQLALPLADRLYLTRVHRNFPGDVRFPKFDESRWHLVDQEIHEADESTPFGFTFATLDRI